MAQSGLAAVWALRATILFGLVVPQPCTGGTGPTQAWWIEARDGAAAMRIEFEMDGGLAYMPGLAKPVAIEVDQLPEAAAREIQDLVGATNFFARPAQAQGDAARGGADQRSYIVTITQGAQHHTVTVREPIEDPALRRLVRLLEEQAREARKRGAAGQSP